MRKTFWLWPLVVVLLLTACAGIAKRQRLDRFDDMERLYRRALLDGDFAGARRLLDPQVATEPLDSEKVKLLKIVDYKPTHVDVTEDMNTIVQQVALKYFMLDTNRLHMVDYQQTWQYDEVHKVWLLQTDLPRLIP